jgi:hypothetical protein
VQLPALKGGVSRKGKYLFQINHESASFASALKGGACREANRSILLNCRILNKEY